MTNVLQRSNLDSDRFSMEVFRGQADAACARQVVLEIVRQRCDLAIVRVKAGDQSLPAALQKMGLPFIHGDTLVYYEADLHALTPKPLRNIDLSFRKANSADRAALDSLIAATFRGYRSHYHSNPLLGPELILEGYKQWGSSFLGRSQGQLWVAERGGGDVIAFAACDEDGEGTIGEGVLYGVSPDASGGGVYGDLIRHTLLDFKARGFSKMKVSTQVWNYAVQKVWAREGFALIEAWDTLHVNALLGSAGELAHTALLTFNAKQVEAFAILSGDRNPIHLDVDVAKTAGFPSTIAHGVLGAAEVSRILGTISPGNGTILTQMSISFHRPLVVGATHTLEVRYVGRRVESGPMKLISTIKDAEGELCLVARTDVVKR